jgi:hypothetical protein
MRTCLQLWVCCWVLAAWWLTVVVGFNPSWCLTGCTEFCHIDSIWLVSSWGAASPLFISARDKSAAFVLVSKTVAEVGRTVGHRRPTAHSTVPTATISCISANSIVCCFSRYCFSPTLRQTAVATETADRNSRACAMHCFCRGCKNGLVGLKQQW